MQWNVIIGTKEKYLHLRLSVITNNNNSRNIIGRFHQTPESADAFVPYKFKSIPIHSRKRPIENNNFMCNLYSLEQNIASRHYKECYNYVFMLCEGKNRHQRHIAAAVIDKNDFL